MSDSVVSPINDPTAVIPNILKKSALDERLDNIQQTLSEMNKKLDDGPSMSLVKANMDKIAELESLKLDAKDFAPVRNIVYGMVALILMGFAGILVAFVFHGQLPR